MDDLRRRFASLDHVPVPYLWDTIELRAAAHEPVARVTTLVAPLPMRSRRSTRRSLVLFLATAAVLVALVAGALAIGSRPPPLPAIVPVPSASASVEAVLSDEGSPSVEPSPSPSAAPWLAVVAYTVQQADCVQTPPCLQRIWLVNADGSGAHELLPDVPGTQAILGWSPDGSRLLYQVPRAEGGLASADVFATDAAGSEPELVCAAGPDPCPFVGGAFSPDGSHLAYVISEGEGDTAKSTVAILDLSTRQVTKLDSTRTTDVRPCGSAASDGLRSRNGAPTWSPDGTRLVFQRDGIGKTVRDGTCRAATIFVVNSDGRELLQLTSPEMVAFAPSWSPDGTRIAFSGDERKPSNELWATDLYTIRPDGTGMRRLTTDGGAGSAQWTSAGQIVFRHFLPGGFFDEVRLMNPDGSGDLQIDHETLADLTAVRCTICPYAPATPSPDGPGVGYWQPAP